MQMKKVAGAVLAVVVLLSMALVGCGPEEVAPPPPAAPPPAAPPPQTAPPPPPPHEEVTLECYAGVLGTGPYMIGLALADLLREKHPWLRIDVGETKGVVPTIKTLDGLPPERRAKSFAANGAHTHLTMAWAGVPPYERAYTDLRTFGSDAGDGYAFGTFDQNIKGPQDMIGKKLASNPVRMAPVIFAMAALEAWGIKDKIDISYHNPPDLKDQLITGLADIVYPVNPIITRGGGYTASPHVAEMLATRQVYWIGFTQEDVDKINDMNVWDTSLLDFPKGALGGNDPPEDVGLITFTSNFYCWDTMEEEYVYEMVKFIIENEEEMSRRAGNLRFDGEFVSTLAPGLPEEILHPGALRYFKEAGLR